MPKPSSDVRAHALPHPGTRTKAGIEEIRGVDADYALRVLIERGLIEEAGRLETAGRPIRYATTLEFLRRFGLGSLADLPALEGDAEALA